ncbi:type 2 lanthipeptide synthetase LanM family protein [Plantactinospora sp. KBS50]|uniref:type 2 lanthipeptide synthetase LanM family protein n=1 Tax=Plantactinospora sp. KBS50 TaxID=2024580 RepID=UPI0018DF622C|nr:type 2 lanthipeptide synthetase LanM family protein [Plantactinospora sp. KBS50]
MTEPPSSRRPDRPDVTPRPTGPTRDLPGSADVDVLAVLADTLREPVAAARDRLLHEVRTPPARPDVPGLSDVPGLPDVADLPGLADGFARELGIRLARLAARTFAAEFDRLQRGGDLAGSTGPQRFADFAHRLGHRGGLADLLARYRRLGRLVASTAADAVEVRAEILHRYVVDRPVLVRELLDGVDPGPLTEVRAGLGDPHQGGRSVARLTFGDGRQVIYKPRGIAAYQKLTELTGWLNRAVPGLELRTAATLSCGGYGYAEFIPHLPLADVRAAERFYRRAGALLALLHAVRGVDLHCENLIACGEHPVIVDAEALFHPELAAAGVPDDPARLLLGASVHRTGMLPSVQVGPSGVADCSGLSGQAGVPALERLDWVLAGADRDQLRPRARSGGGRLNMPRLRGRELDPSDHGAALLSGLRAGYDAIMNDRPGFRDLLAGCADVETRLVFRPTLTYALLLDGATHPDLLRDAAGAQRAFTVLSQHPAVDPLRRPLVQHEVADLLRGDIPVFTAVPDRRDVWASTGERLPDLLPSTGLADAAAVLSGMGAADRRDQEWIVSAALASRQPVDEHRPSAVLPGPIVGHEAGPDRLLTAACGIADQILARGVTDAGRVNWLGLEVVDGARWMVLPMGAALSNGYLGVALFLGQLAELTGLGRYREAALRAASAAGPLCESLAGRPDLAVHVGPGGYQGFGGICYGLSRLAVLLGDARLRDWLEAGIAAAGSAVGAPTGAPGPLGVAGGLAGCLAAMRAVHAELGLASAAALAATCADRLGEALPAGGPPAGGPLPAGYAEGHAGIAWARSAAGANPVAPGPTPAVPAVGVGAGAGVGAAVPSVDAGVPSTGADAASAGAAGSDPDAAPIEDFGWCRGVAGIVAAGGMPSGDERGRIVRRFAQRPVLRDLSLCHGELGITETLVVLAAADPDRSVQRVLRWRAGLVLDAIERFGPGCGTPHGVGTPGLFNGLAGIGYGLLRLGFPARVPSALLLEPGRTSTAVR